MIAKEEKKTEKEFSPDVQENDDSENIFFTEEITIEEMAIDGICGVY